MNKLIIMTATAAITAGAATGAMARDVDLDKIGGDFDRLDKNQDSVLSHEEVEGHNLMTYFNGIDRNNDDQVSEKEFDSYLDRYPYIVKGSEQNS